MGLLGASDLAMMRDIIDETLPDTCNILGESWTSDGQGGVTSTWGVTAGTIACRLDSVVKSSQGLTLVGESVRPEREYTLSLPYNTAIAPGDRVEVGAYTFTVTSVNEGISWAAVKRATLKVFGSTIAQDYYRYVVSTFGSGLIGYWPMSEASGTVATDKSGVSGNGAYGGTFTLGQTGIGDGFTAFKNTAGALAFHSAAYASAFNGAEGTAIVWIKVADAAHWIDNVDEYALSIFATSGQVRFRKYPGANLLNLSYVAGGVTDTIAVSRYETRWMMLAFTWSKTGEIVTAYINGSFIGSSATLGVWSGTLSANLNCFGALRNDSYSNPFKGYLAHGGLWSRALTGPEIKSLHDRAVPTVGVFCLGDSKTGPSYPWYRLAMDTLATDIQAFEERPVRYYTAGWKVSDLKAYVVANLAAEWQTANRAWINIGANDLSAGTSEASFKADLTAIVDAVRAKFSGIRIFIAKPWRRGYDAAGVSMAGWIDAVIALYASGVQSGPDENVWLKSNDDGALYTLDGVHYSVAGTTEAAAQWAALT